MVYLLSCLYATSISGYKPFVKYFFVALKLFVDLPHFWCYTVHGKEVSSLNERIKKLRKTLDLTQQEFADKLCIKRNTVATYETGKSNPSDAAVVLICKTFNVSETWLRTGDGEMFLQQTEEDQIAAAVERLITGESSEFKKRLVLALSTLKDEHWLLLEQKLKEIVGEISGKEQLEAEVDKEVERYRQQLLSEKEPDTPASSAKESGAV